MDFTELPSFFTTTLAPLPIPTVRDVGVARPSAQGQAMINTLTTGADQLTLADSNEEGANLLALQTRQQLSTTALSLAAQADQNVLRLFQ